MNKKFLLFVCTLLVVSLNPKIAHAVGNFMSNLSVDRKITRNYGTPGNTSPWNTTPGNASPNDATPSDATPGNASPSDASPSDATPSVADVSVYADCSKNGYTKVITFGHPIMGTATVSSSAGRTSCDVVQLWEGGPHWATFNVGATITDYAQLTTGADATSFYNYTDQATYYNTANVGGLYAWNNPNLNGRKTTWDSNVSTGISDVATTLWGSNWKTPTQAQLDTLRNSTYGKTTWTWCDGSTTQYVAGCTLKGYKVSGVGDYASYSIFLPAAGYFGYYNGTVSDASHTGRYWSNTDYNSFNAYFLIFGSGNRGINYFDRKYGLSFRAVLAQQTTVSAASVTLTLYADDCPTPNTIICHKGQQLRIKADASLEGSRFHKWSDGVTDNPRLVTINSDTVFTAIYGNFCGDSLQWEFANGVLSISGSGAMYDFTQSGQPWNADAANITNIVFPNGMTHVGNYAFYGLQNRAFTSLVLPKTVETIGAYAFANCNRLTSISLPASLLEIANFAFSGCNSVNDITSLAATRPDIYENTFKDVSSYAYLYVPCDYKRSYQLNSYWSRFDLQCVGAEPSTNPVPDVTVVPAENTVTITWPTNTNANTYTIEIKKDGITFCTLTFNDQGQLMNISFAPSRGMNNELAAEAVAGGYKFTITSLNPGTNYNYEVDTQDAAGKSIANYTGEFTTTGGTATSFDQLPNSPSDRFTKIIRDGQLFILRDGKTYNAQGGEL